MGQNMTIFLKLAVPVACGLLVLPLFQAAQHDWQSDLLLQAAERQTGQFDFDLAAVTLQKAIDLQPNNAALHLSLANVRRTLYKFRQEKRWLVQAEASYSKAAQLNPVDARIHYEWALMYSWTQNHPKALQVLQKALQLDPNNGGYWLEQGRYLERLGKIRAARAAYAQSQRKTPNGEARAALLRLKETP